MQAIIPSKLTWRFHWRHAGWACLLILACLLWTPELKVLWGLWHSDPMLSHGPLIPLIAGAHLWMRRSDLKWKSASRAGLLALGLTTLAYVAAVWADIDFLIPLALVGMIAAGIWFLGGHKTLLASAGALGFLVFMIPWPTTITDRFGFPLQMMSSTYAALFGGLLGLPVQRDGVQLAVVPDPHKAPVYQCIVAVQCSGLTSLLVLLALGYLIAYHTPVSLGWRAVMVAIMPPLALITNTIRIVFILLAGTYINAHFAKWVHDHEGPVLIFLCSFALLGIRHAILTYTQPRKPSPASEPPAEGPMDVPLPIIDP
ncbi:MAG TPA: exosortase/archaeosortase family protein [Chthonomonadaceae bacterium]|nr:exosortase/archaeosortase family protein [Chthonomonadaceae bacterium]